MIVPWSLAVSPDNDSIALKRLPAAVAATILPASYQVKYPPIDSGVGIVELGE